MLANVPYEKSAGGRERNRSIGGLEGEGCIWTRGRKGEQWIERDGMGTINVGGER